MINKEKVRRGPRGTASWGSRSRELLLEQFFESGAGEVDPDREVEVVGVWSLDLFDDALGDHVFESASSHGTVARVFDLEGVDGEAVPGLVLSGETRVVVKDHILSVPAELAHGEDREVLVLRWVGVLVEAVADRFEDFGWLGEGLGDESHGEEDEASTSEGVEEDRVGLAEVGERSAGQEGDAEEHKDERHGSSEWGVRKGGLN